MNNTEALKQKMKNGIWGLLGTVAICAAIVAVVFGALGALIGLDFATVLAYFAGLVFVLAIYGMVVVWVIGFDWTDMPFAKATGAGILMAALELYRIRNF